MYDTFDNTYQATIGKHTCAMPELINRYRLLIKDHVSGGPYCATTTVGYRCVLYSSLMLFLLTVCSWVSFS